MLQAVGLLKLLELPLLLGGRRRFLLDGRLLLPGGGGAAALLAGLFFGRGRRLGGATRSLGLALLLLGGWFEVPVVIRSVGVFFVLDSGTLPSTIAVAIRFGRGGSSGGGGGWFGVLLFDLVGYRTSRSRGLQFLLLLELPERDIVVTVTAAHNAVWYRPMCKIMGGDGASADDYDVGTGRQAGRPLVCAEMSFRIGCDGCAMWRPFLGTIASTAFLY